MNHFTSRDVLLFIPNIIGYSRVVASLISFVLMVCTPQFWFQATLLYLYSFAADLFDGIAARKYNQCSTFGSLLDMLTDRCSTLGLFFVLYGEYGQVEEQQLSSSLYKLTFLFLALLDISSHWSQQYSTAMLQIHHKSSEGNATRFFLVKWYYTNYPFFGYCCVSAELTYVLLYVLLHLNSMGGPFFRQALEILLQVVLPGCIMKQIVNVFQLTSSCEAVASEDALVRNRRHD